MKIENLKPGDKIEYNFGHDDDYRVKVIEAIEERKGIIYAKFENTTGYWPLDEKFIKPANFKPGKIVERVGFFGELIFV